MPSVAVKVAEPDVVPSVKVNPEIVPPTTVKSSAIKFSTASEKVKLTTEELSVSFNAVSMISTVTVGAVSSNCTILKAVVTSLCS